jgi:hypothetical protein
LALLLIGAALGLALLCALFAYFNEAFIAFWNEVQALWWCAVIAGVLSLGLLAVGAFFGFQSIRETVRQPARAEPAAMKTVLPTKGAL